MRTVVTAGPGVGATVSSRGGGLSPRMHVIGSWLLPCSGLGVWGVTRVVRAHGAVRRNVKKILRDLLVVDMRSESSRDFERGGSCRDHL